MKYFTQQHEWVEVSGGIATVGISNHAATELGDITFIELPQPGTVFHQGDVASVVESVKAASDIYAPVSGTVTIVNDALAEKPEIVNESPERDGWIFRLESIGEEELRTLMDEGAYKAFIAEDRD